MEIEKYDTGNALIYRRLRGRVGVSKTWVTKRGSIKN